MGGVYLEQVLYNLREPPIFEKAPKSQNDLLLCKVLPYKILGDSKISWNLFLPK